MLSAPPVSPGWKVKDLIEAVIILLALGSSYRLLGQFIDNWRVYFYISTIIQSGLLIVIVVTFAILRYRGTWRDLGLIGTYSNPWQILTKGFLGGISLALIILISGLFLQQVVPEPSDGDMQPIAKVVLESKSWVELLAPLFLAALIVPLAEELFFRGFAYPVFRQKFGITLGIAMSGIFFGAMHFDILRTLPLSLGGMGLAYLYEKSGSLWTSIIAHGMWNGLMTLLLFWGMPPL